jgi:hypothetical protein
VLSLWAAFALVTLIRAEDLRDWVAEADRAAWAGAAVDDLVEIAGRVGFAAVRERSEAVRAALYGAPGSAPPAQGVRVATPSAATSAEPDASRSPSVPPAFTSAPAGSGAAWNASEPHLRPKRVLLVGASSMQFALGQALEKQLSTHAGLEVRRLGKASTGLSRPDGFNWPARLEALLDEHEPDLVIVNFGGNDGQNIPLPEGKRAVFGTDAWDRVYSERVADFVTRIRARGAQAVMIGMPIMRSPDFSERMKRLNAVTERATETAGGIFLDQWDLAAALDGKYRERVDEKGKSRPMRLEDGIHYTDAGGRYVAAHLLSRLERYVRFDVDAQ